METTCVYLKRDADKRNEWARLADDLTVSLNPYNNCAAYTQEDWNKFRTDISNAIVKLSQMYTNVNPQLVNLDDLKNLECYGGSPELFEFYKRPVEEELPF